jgi:uncharacterized BrkB/YihY/UPF0761 family membrane protein
MDSFGLVYTTIGIVAGLLFILPIYHVSDMIVLYEIMVSNDDSTHKQILNDYKNNIIRASKLFAITMSLLLATILINCNIVVNTTNLLITVVMSYYLCEISKTVYIKSIGHIINYMTSNENYNHDIGNTGHRYCEFITNN